jgi:hypothetical protein
MVGAKRIDRNQHDGAWRRGREVLPGDGCRPGDEQGDGDGKRRAARAHHAASIIQHYSFERPEVIVKSRTFVIPILGVAVMFMVGGARILSAAPPDPCSVLTSAQVSDVLGVPVADGQHLATTVCQWAPSGASTANSKKLTVTFQNARAFDYAKTPVPSAKITKTPVTGIGDDAVLGTTQGVATVLTVKKGDVVFVVHVFGLPDDQAAAKEKALALKILQKI